jgi:hypothetical protein
MFLKDQYFYEIFPVTMFPFFCAPADSEKKIQPYKALYLQGTAIGLHLDEDSIKHIQIAVLSFTTPQEGMVPEIKIYTMYFYKQTTANEWNEDRVPLVVSLFLKKDGTYMVKN